MNRKSAMSPAQIVSGVQNNQPEAHAALYELLQRTPRYFLWKECGADATEDYLHDVYIIVVQAIRAGDIRVPDALRLFVRTVVRRTVAQHIDRQVRTRNREVPQDDIDVQCNGMYSSPEKLAIQNEINGIVAESLREISETDQEIMVRFYQKGQNRIRVCEEMGLSEPQFRIRKSRAKANVVADAKSRLAGSSRRRLADLVAA